MGSIDVHGTLSTLCIHHRPNDMPDIRRGLGQCQEIGRTISVRMYKCVCTICFELTRILSTTIQHPIVTLLRDINNACVLNNTQIEYDTQKKHNEHKVTRGLITDWAKSQFQRRANKLSTPRNCMSQHSIRIPVKSRICSVE